MVNAIATYDDVSYNCKRGYYLPMQSEGCTKCLANSYCPGGKYLYATNADQGINACPGGLMSPTGMWESGQCGRILHIGNDIVYLRSERKTTPSLNIDINNDGVPDFFANMTQSDITMNNQTDNKLKMRVGDNSYSIYDDTIESE